MSTEIMSYQIMDFYPRPPRGGRRVLHYCMPSQIRFLSTPSARRATPVLARVCPALKFLSTPSARRATFCKAGSVHPLCDFYPRPPRGGRRYYQEHKAEIWEISIHALREEGDPLYSVPGLYKLYFYPRPPRGGRRRSIVVLDVCSFISIHALREEGDAFDGLPRIP